MRDSATRTRREGERYRRRRAGIALSIQLTAVLVASPSLGQYTFGTDRRVNDDPPGLYIHYLESSGQHSIAAQGDTINLAWLDGRTGWGAVFHARSSDHGKTFTPNVCVSDTAAALYPSLALGPDGTIYIAWADFRHDPYTPRVFFDKSTDGGISWGEDLRIETQLTNSGFPSVAVDQVTGAVYVAWVACDAGYCGVYVSRSLDGGNSFDPGVRAVPPGQWGSAGDYPSIGVGPEGNVYVAWEANERPDGGVDIWAATSRDGGASFESVYIGKGVWVSLAVSPEGTVYVAFSGATHWSGEYFKLDVAASWDDGTSFCAPVTVYNYAPGKKSAVAGSGDRLYLAWTPADGRVYFQLSDTWPQFSNPQLVNDGTSPHGMFPSICAMDNGAVAIAWEDYRYSAIRPDIYLDIGRLAMSSVTPTPAPQPMSHPEVSISASPNPFVQETVLVFRGLDLGTLASLRIISTDGRLVQEFGGFLGSSDATHTVRWDGTDSRGFSVSSGIYFVVARTPSGTAQLRVVKVR